MTELNKTDEEILKNIDILSEALESAVQCTNEFYIDARAKLQYFQHLIVSKYKK